MIFIILGAIIGAISAADEMRVFELVMGGLIGALVGGLITLGMTVICCIFNWGALDAVTTVETHELVQISDVTYSDISGNIGGNIFVVRGNIGTDLAAGFSFYQKETDGFSLKAVGADNTTIKYTDETPRIEVTRTYCPKLDNGPSIGLLWINRCSVGGGNVWNTIYVPEGSIAEGFKLGDK